ncbi:MAG: hypothetical protein QRY72_00035 [Candidatus Rhabdochlamydia sp.]
MTTEYHSKDLDHLGIVSQIYDDWPCGDDRFLDRECEDSVNDDRLGRTLDQLFS